MRKLLCIVVMIGMFVSSIYCGMSFLYTNPLFGKTDSLLSPNNVIGCLVIFSLLVSHGCTIHVFLKLYIKCGQEEAERIQVVHQG